MKSQKKKRRKKKKKKRKKEREKEKRRKEGRNVRCAGTTIERRMEMKGKDPENDIDIRRMKKINDVRSNNLRDRLMSGK